MWVVWFDDLYRMHISTLKLKAGETEQEVLRNTYKYKDGELAGSTTNYVEQHVINDRTYDYTYDVRGNITQISLNGTVIATYTYDEFDQLISETANGVTTTWTYDAGGNILTKSHNNTTIEYKYEDSEWKDLLTSYNGKTITYDEIGNPLTIGTDTTLTWEAGRRLASITKAGVTTSFTYNADGYRTSKTSGGVTTTYHLDGSRITAMLKGIDELSFAYDENGLLTGLYHNGTAYAYAKNLQGDIIGIIDGTGNWVVTYEYDAWGNPIATSGTLAETLGQLNPFRYRGYVYDAETGFYYVSSRYYDPEIGRFINADNAISGTGESVQGYNLYSYCFNNPVNMSDPTGNWPKWVTSIVNTAKKVVNKIVNNVKKSLGIAIQVNKEDPGVSQYSLVFSYENGMGYNKSFDTGKPANLYKTIPNSLSEITKAGAGLDVNINGYGGSIQVGNEKALTVHLKNSSYELGRNILGRTYFKYSQKTDSGAYIYHKVSINNPEIGAGILLYVFNPSLALAGAGAAGAIIAK